MQTDLEFTASSLVNGKLSLTNTRIVEFSVEDENGELVMPSRSYDESSQTTTVDFSGWTINGTWHIRVIPVEKGLDAEPGIELNEYLVNMYLMRTDGRYFPYVGSKSVFQMLPSTKTPLLSNRFFASGAEQMVYGKVTPVIIPALGENRQFVGTGEITPSENGALYQFRVYRADTMIFDQVQDSLNFSGNGDNHGNIFYFSPNVIAKDPDTLQKYRYKWRVRASSKFLDENGEPFWSTWSPDFPFTVNIPPGIPKNLSVFSDAS